MTARQDIDITSVSTFNSFEMLRDLRACSWTLSASAHLNTTYTALTSGLTHPDGPVATQGDMSHLRASIDIGPVARYVNGSFQSELRLPVAMTCTWLGNAPVADEETDARRVRLRLQPSFSLLWKATDNLTFSGSANYSASETDWTKLLTASVMQNYRSLSRYRAALNDSHSAGARGKVAFRICSAAFSPIWKASGTVRGATSPMARPSMRRHIPSSRQPTCLTTATIIL